MDESLSYLWIMEPYLVGIAGGTASGKSTLTHQLIRCAGEERAAVVELDAYYRPQDHLLFEERVLTNYDHPDTFEFSLLIQHLQVLKRGESVDSPVYDFAQHARRAGDVKQVAVRPVIFIEGFLVLANPEVCALLDLRIFVHAPDELRLSRRLLRDVNERGRTEQGVLQQWHSTVYPMHQQFCAPSKSAADIVIDGSAWTSLDVEQLWADVWARYLMKQRTLCSSAVEV